MQEPKLLLASFAAAIFCLPAAAITAEFNATPAVVPASPAQPTYSEVPADMAALLPGGLTVVLMTNPLAEIEGVALGLAEQIAPEIAAMVSIDTMLARIGLDPAMLDKTKPICFAVGALTMADEPQAFLVVPTTRGDMLMQLVVAMSGMPAEALQTKVVGDYMGITMGATYPESGESELLGTVPNALMGLAIDVEAIVDTFGPMINLGMGMVRMQATSDLSGDMPMDLGALLDTYFGMAESAMDSIEQARFSINITDSLLDIREEFVISEGSPMSSIAADGNTDIAKLLPLMGNDSMSMVLGADMGDLIAKMQPLMESMMGAYPVEMGQGLLASMEVFNELYSLFGEGMVVSGGFSDHGLHATAFFDGASFDELLTAYKGALELPFWGQLGMKYIGTKTGKSGDVKVTRFTFDFDMSAFMEMMGEDIPEGELAEVEKMITALYGDSLVLTFAKTGGTGIMVLGADDTLMINALGRVAAGGKIPDELARLGDLAANSNPFLSYGIDMGEMISTMIPVLEKSMGAPAMGMEMFEGVHLPMNIYFGATKTMWTTGIMVDLIQVSEFVQMISIFDQEL
jgi:hypothetical protein